MQAIIITAYKNEKQLLRLVNYFRDFQIYIHIDLKSDIDTSIFSSFNNVKVIKQYSIGWGTINHIKAIIQLMRMALNDKKCEYIHIISGQDMPVRSLKDFHSFFPSKKIYMEYFDVSDLNNKFKRRYSKGTISSNLNQKSKFTKLLNFIYGMLHKKRENIGEFKRIYKGLIWMSMPREVGEYILNYIEKNEFLKELNHVIIPEEFIFQTIILNSKFRGQVVNNNLRYNDWSKKRNGSFPAILDETDYKKIINGNYFFARKIDSEISKKLINLFEKRINF